MLSRSCGGLKVKPKNTFIPPSGCFIVNISFTQIKRCFDDCYYRMFRLNIKLFPLYNFSHISFFANFLDALSIIANVCTREKVCLCLAYQTPQTAPSVKTAPTPKLPNSRGRSPNFPNGKFVAAPRRLTPPSAPFAAAPPSISTHLSFSHQKSLLTIQPVTVVITEVSVKTTSVTAKVVVTAPSAS